MSTDVFSRSQAELFTKIKKYHYKKYEGVDKKILDVLISKEMLLTTNVISKIRPILSKKINKEEALQLLKNSLHNTYQEALYTRENVFENDYYGEDALTVFEEKNNKKNVMACPFRKDVLVDFEKWWSRRSFSLSQTLYVKIKKIVDIITR